MLVGLNQTLRRRRPKTYTVALQERRSANTPAGSSPCWGRQHYHITHIFSFRIMTSTAAGDGPIDRPFFGRPNGGPSRRHICVGGRGRLPHLPMAPLTASVALWAASETAWPAFSARGFAFSTASCASSPTLSMAGLAFSPACAANPLMSVFGCRVVSQ